MYMYTYSVCTSAEYYMSHGYNNYRNADYVSMSDNTRNHIRVNWHIVPRQPPTTPLIPPPPTLLLGTVLHTTIIITQSSCIAAH